MAEMKKIIVRIANLAESEHSRFMSVFSGIEVFFGDCLNGLSVDWVLTFGRKVQRTPVDPVAGLLKMLCETSFFEAGNVWQDFFKSNVIEKLDMLSDVKCCADIDSNAGIGMMYNFKNMSNFEFIIGDFVQVGTEIPDGLLAKYIPDGLTAHIQFNSAYSD